MIHETGVLAIMAVGIFVLAMGLFAGFRTGNPRAGFVLSVAGVIIFALPVFLLDAGLI